MYKHIFQLVVSGQTVVNWLIQYEKLRLHCYDSCLFNPEVF